ncbi:restriction endonuclease [Embleya sp. NBC_00896]|uniref:restriction endonuclease n=1 Tax=Embleya sp. NBC_00896 TaxID=2975961 RepID=UPI00386D898A|nr:restriction endonuclease [Embleya sp. NBC_00896]
MASRRSTGVLGTWAELQRQQQRQREAEFRAQQQQLRADERRRRDAQKAAARADREAQRAYQQSREAEVARRTAEIDDRVAELQGVLRARLSEPGFHIERLRVGVEIPPFQPGELARPIPMPDPARYQVAPPSGFGSFAPGAQSRYEYDRAQAQARYDHDLRAAQAAEYDRQQRYTDYHRQYQDWANGQRALADQRNGQVDDLVRRLAARDPEAIEDYFEGVLLASPDWPEGFSDRSTVAFDPALRQLVVDHELPGVDVVPAIARVRYVKSEDQEKDVARTATDRRAIHRDVLAQSAVRILAEVFFADHERILDSVVLNGFVDAVNPATGRPGQTYLLTVTARAEDFRHISLDRVDAVACLDAMNGTLSARPDRPTPVQPSRLADSVASAPTPVPVAPVPVRPTLGSGDDDPDLFVMDPIAFEDLIADLFQRMGMQVETTARSGDQGVDVVAVDSDPIRGGKIVVQVKRYRNTVPPTAVRDLWGTVQHHGANKGLLVTTSGFGPGSHEFIRNKPLGLVTGPELVGLLAQHGLRGRLGPGAGAAGAGPSAAPGSRVLVQLGWDAGDVPALDPCAFVCTRGRVLSDEHFVFFNNPASPEGAVRVGDGVAFLVDLALLPSQADRLVLAAAVDEESAPGRDLSTLRGARLTRLDQADGRRLGDHAVPTRRAGETAMVLGAFVRSEGTWSFSPTTNGYRNGLLGVAESHGVEVE